MAQVLRLAASTLTAVLVAGCAVVLDASAPPGTLKPSYTLAPPSPAFSPARTLPHPQAAHGQPYAGPDLASLIRASAVPPSLKTDAIAEAIAPRIWTYDGQPYQEVFVSGSCDDDGVRCDLTVMGVPDFAISRDNADVYLFAIHTDSGLIEDHPPQATEGFPADLVPELDDAARTDADDRIGQRTLRWVTWLAQPASGDAFLLHYAVDDSAIPDVEIVYDRAAGTVSVRP